MTVMIPPQHLETVKSATGLMFRLKEVLKRFSDLGHSLDGIEASDPEILEKLIRLYAAECHKTASVMDANAKLAARLDALAAAGVCVSGPSQP